MGVLLDSELARSEHIYIILQNLKIICDFVENVFPRTLGTLIQVCVRKSSELFYAGQTANVQLICNMTYLF